MEECLKSSLVHTDILLQSVKNDVQVIQSSLCNSPKESRDGILLKSLMERLHKSYYRLFKDITELDRAVLGCLKEQSLLSSTVVKLKPVKESLAPESEPYDKVEDVSDGDSVLSAETDLMYPSVTNGINEDATLLVTSTSSNDEADSEKDQTIGDQFFGSKTLSSRQLQQVLETEDSSDLKTSNDEDSIVPLTKKGNFSAAASNAAKHSFLRHKKNSKESLEVFEKQQVSDNTIEILNYSDSEEISKGYLLEELSDTEENKSKSKTDLSRKSNNADTSTVTTKGMNSVSLDDDIKLRSNAVVVLEKVDSDVVDLINVEGKVKLSTLKSVSVKAECENLSNVDKAIRLLNNKITPLSKRGKKSSNRKATCRSSEALSVRKKQSSASNSLSVFDSTTSDESSDEFCTIFNQDSEPSSNSPLRESEPQFTFSNSESPSDSDIDEKTAASPKKSNGHTQSKHTLYKSSKNVYRTPAIAKLLTDSEDEARKELLHIDRDESSVGKHRLMNLRISSDESGSDSDQTRKNGKRLISSDELSDAERLTSSKRTKKKRRKIVQNSSSEDSMDKAETCESNLNNDEAKSPEGKGRKNIRKMINKEKLQASTKEAQQEEEERRIRILERQKKYNEEHIMTGEEGSVGRVYSRLTLDADDLNEPLVEVDPLIVKSLKEHQVQGIRFLYDNCIESVSKVKEGHKGGGCILAHCMGLGKTLQVISFLHTVINSENLPFKNAMIVAPLTTVDNWSEEIQHWTDGCTDLYINKIWECKSNKLRLEALRHWMNNGGVALLHYELLRTLIFGSKKITAKMHREFLRYLTDPGPDIFVCDEGHLLKNSKSKLSKALFQIKTTRKIVLTGTPLQNHLNEYFTMVNFVKPNLLGTENEFRNRFVNPIKNGQHADSNDYDVKKMKRRSHVLHKLLDGCLQRKNFNVLTPYLPPKFEYVVNVRLSQKQRLLYTYFLENLASREASKLRLLQDYSQLVKIWTHPIVLTLKKYDGREMDDFIRDDESDKLETDTSEDEVLSGLSSGEIRTRHKSRSILEAHENRSIDDIQRDWWSSLISEEELSDEGLSGKMVVLKQIIKACEEIGDKLLIFSQYLSSLDMIEKFLEAWDVAAIESESEFQRQVGRWRKNIEYFRIDGGTKAEDRQKKCVQFNKMSTISSSSSKSKLFLISTKAGGLGINLHGANRVVIFDTSWNPSQDMQSIFRVYRFGQTKPCYVYRLLAKGTMEEKIYRRQVVKLSLSHRVVDEHQIERHFRFDDVHELYKLEDNDEVETPAVPKDPLLADLLIPQGGWIHSYFEHDTLLQNIADEELSEEERKAAWEEYKTARDELPTIRTDNLIDPAVKQAAKQKIATTYAHLNEETRNYMLVEWQKHLLTYTRLADWVNTIGSFAPPQQLHDLQNKKAIARRAMEAIIPPRVMQKNATDNDNSVQSLPVGNQQNNYRMNSVAPIDGVPNSLDYSIVANLMRNAVATTGPQMP